MSTVSFILVDPRPALISEWASAFAEHLSVDDQARFVFLQSTLEQLQPPHAEFDCIVSPANSYGIMDGGFDYNLSEAFSPPDDFFVLSRLVQGAIKSRYYGMAPPGTCTLVPDLPPNSYNCRVLAVCPTMRYPMQVRWHQEIVYNTMWSLLVELEQWNERFGDDKRIKKVFMTGLGTGVGRVGAKTCAQQMALAVKHFMQVRSEAGKEAWSKPGYPDWNDVLPAAKEL